MRKHYHLMTTALGLCLAFVCACGGGGGGGSASGPASPAYTGPTTQATLASSGTAATIATAALAGADTGNIAMGVQTSGKSFTPAQLAWTTGSLRDLVTRQGFPAAAAGLTDTVQDGYGGYATFTGNSSTTATSYVAQGTITFHSYHVSSAASGMTVVDGSVYCSMTGISRYDFTFTMSSGWLQIASGNGNCIYSLDYQCQVSGGVAGTVTLSATFLAPDLKVYRIADYTIVANAYDYSISIIGTFYHPDYGYVTVDTPATLYYSNCGGVYLPTSGVLRITGANGVADFQPIDCYSFAIHCSWDATTTVYYW